MTGSAIGLSFNYGFAGNVSRTPDCIIENRPVKSTSADLVFGSAVVQNTDNTYSLWDVNGTAALFAGVAVAEVKQALTYPSSTSAAGAYTANQPADVIKRGTVSVKTGRGTPTAGGDVYLRTVLNTAYPNSKIGDWESSTDSGKNIKITNVCWNTGLVDANGIAELKIKSINN